MNSEDREPVSRTTRSRKDYQQQEKEGDPMQSNPQNSGVPKKEEAVKIEFEKFPNSDSFVTWKKQFVHAVLLVLEVALHDRSVIILREIQLIICFLVFC